MPVIYFYYENDLELSEEREYRKWLTDVAESEKKRIGEINFIFCNDDYLLRINQDYLSHDTYTDIISFDNSLGNILNGDIFISTERVKENASFYGVSFAEELRRVMVHGILHYCGYKDKTESNKAEMRLKEEEKMKMFHVEQ